MALCTDAVMVLFYDIAGDPDDHDDWHSFEHFHERLSVPGFRRATRWIATQGAPRYLVTYEVENVKVATSRAYLDRLNDPTDWTSVMMPRFRGMTRGFCDVVASAGFGLGKAAAAVRFTPESGAESQLVDWAERDAFPALASRRGVVGVHLMRPAAPPPMTREQALRGADKPMPWVILASGYDAEELERAVVAHLAPELLDARGAAGIGIGHYALHYSAEAGEVARTPKPQVLDPGTRRQIGPRNMGPGR